jgi:hypothetical protein
MHETKHLKKIARFVEKNSFQDLWQHNKSVHLKIRFTYDICSKVCNSRALIISHMQKAHLNKYHSCKICDEKFKDLRSLWSHSFKHLRFKCQPTAMIKFFETMIVWWRFEKNTYVSTAWKNSPIAILISGIITRKKG